MRVRQIVPLAALAAVSAAPAVAQAPATLPQYKTMIVKDVAKKSVQATLGHYCHPDGNGGGHCTAPGTIKYPLEGTGTVSISKEGRVQLLLGTPAKAITFRAARIDGRGDEVVNHAGNGRAVTKTFKRWEIKIPNDLRKSTKLLGFDVTYQGGFYSSFEVGTKIVAKKKTSSSSSSSSK